RHSERERRWSQAAEAWWPPEPCRLHRSWKRRGASCTTGRRHLDLAHGCGQGRPRGPPDVSCQVVACVAVALGRNLTNVHGRIGGRGPPAWCEPCSWRLALRRGESAMKVVLFCGGLGTRLRELTGEIPKPMVKIGYRPILWHLMKYYAHFGHKDFVLCLGYKADVIKQFFLQYEEWISNDFTLSRGGKDLKLERSDIEDWNITFVDTGLHANIGQRPMAVRKYVEADEMFLANYSDGLTDLDLEKMIQTFRSSGHVAS